MSRLTKFLGSTVGAKFVVAVTGTLLSLFVVGHLAGNLLLFRGRDAMNTYAESLQHLGAALWLIRGGLLAVFATHIVLAIRLKLRNQSARPAGYAHEATVQASWASRSMVLTGLVVLAFVLMHLAHFTLGWLEPTKYAVHETVGSGDLLRERHDVYAMVVLGFRSDLFVALYVVAMVVLGLHLSHALQSLFQSFGFRSPSFTPVIERVCGTVAWVLAAGFLLIPLAVRLDLVGTEVTP
ncbi:MAG: succinate dehydrogenase cytochrome b subunit [Planctomycetes bacterium]|nr:succinate dehydrogenase cytochrome b subunit [Planctomycetota bacterium]